MAPNQSMGSHSGALRPDPFTHLTIQEFFLDTIHQHSVPGVIFLPESLRQCTFVPQRVVDEYFDCTFENDLARVKNLVTKATEYAAAKPTARAVAQRCRRVFTILLIIGHSEHIGSFVENQNLWDRRLPFRPDDRRLFPKLSGGEDFFDDFYQEQWRFCVEPLSHSLDPVTMDDKRILPIIHIERLDKHEGVSAVVRKITVHPDYDGLDEALADETTQQQSSHDYVVKSYHHLEAQRYYDAEVGAFRELHGSGVPIPNLIGFHGAFRQNKSLHIILEYANIGTLEDYFAAANPPRRGQDIVSLWQNLLKLNDALAQIHGLPQSEDRGKPRIFQGWHQDIKPNNILVSGDIDKPYEVKFMLADLGLSHYAAVVEDKAGLTGEDRIGSQAYSAPERNLARGLVSSFGHLVKQKSDIWSLACVYSEVLAWIVDGVHGDLGVNKYREARQSESDGSTGACFHCGKGELLDKVPEWHRELMDRCATQDPITPILWDDLLQHMFHHMSEDRLNAYQVRAWSNGVMQKARNKLLSLRKAVELSILKRNNIAPPSSPDPPAFRPRTPPNVPNDYRGFPMTPPYGGNAGAPHTVDTEHAPALTHSPNSLNADTSPRLGLTNKRESSNSIPGCPSYRNSGMAVRTSSENPPRVTNTYFSERPVEHYVPERESSQRLNDTIADLVATMGGLPLHEEPLQPQGTSVIQRPPRDLPEEEPDPPGKGKAAAEEPTKKRKPTKSLTVGQLRTWAELTRNLSWRRNTTHELDHEAELIPELKGRDHLFVIDDGESMRRHWRSLVSLYHDLIYMVKKKELDPNGSELQFIISDRRKEARNTSEMAKMVADMGHQLKGESNFAARLDKIFTEYQERLTRKKKRRPLSIYVLTDGVWQGGRQETMVGRAIERMVNFLERGGYPDNMVGIQFIRFGNDAEGIARLRWLDAGLKKDFGLKRDICDTTSADGNVWKMMLGSINDYWDDDPD